MSTSPLRYAELQVTSHFSFLRGASSCEEALGGGAPVDGAIDLEQGVDALHRLQRDRRDDGDAALRLAAGDRLQIG